MGIRVVSALALFAGGVMLGTPLWAPLSAQSTEGTITGRVTDARSGSPLASASVTIVGTQLGGSTGPDGTYRIGRVPAGSHMVTARELGFTPVTKAVTVASGENASADFALQASAVSLQQVVVTGTAGNQTRAAQGAVVATIDASAVTDKAPLTNVSQLLTGRVPGVSVQTSSGTLGAASRILIRGAASVSLSNQPLVFIDGVRMQSGQRSLVGVSSGIGGQTISALNDINPDDIESIEVVKGPAAATLYGADASAGVIQIITKKGRLGAKRFAQNIAVEYDNIEPNFTPPANYAVCKNGYAAIVPLCADQPVGAIISDNPLVREGAFKNGNMQSLRYSGQGGGDNYSFYISGDADDQTGTSPNTYLTRRSGRANLTWNATPKLSVDARLGLSRNDYKLPNGDQSNYGYLILGEIGSPLQVTKAADGTLGGGWSSSVPAISSIVSEENSLRSTPTLQLNYNPFHWLTNRLILGADLSNTDGTTFFPRNTNNWYSGAQANGYISAARENDNIYTVDYLGNIDSKLGHDGWISSNLSFGSQFINTTTDLVTGTGTGLATNLSNLVSSGATTTGSQGFTQQKSLGYFVQEQLGFNDRLFLTAAGRVDRNSAFGSEAGSYFLPKVGASWVVSQEPYWQRFTPLISTLRFRAAYGTTGRSPVPGSSLRTYAPFSYITDNGAVVPGVRPLSPGNQDLKPERGKEFEAGFDAGFFNERAGLEVTYFNKKTSDLLLLEPLAPSLGYGQNPFANLGSAINRGFEFVVRATPIDRKDLKWDATFNASTVHNELTSLGNLSPIKVTEISLTREFVPGRPLDSYFGTKIKSVDAKTGVTTVSDTAEYLGSPIPNFEGSFNTTLTLFSNLRLYAEFEGKRGYKVFNVSEYYRDQLTSNSAQAVLPAGKGGYSAEQKLERFGPYVSESGQPVSPGTVIDPYVQSGDYIRFQEFSATLTLPKRLAAGLHSTGASITLGGRNLHLWSSKFEGYDPSVLGTGVGSANTQYTQFATYELFTVPPVRTWIARLNLNF
jgi:TonB-dependent starch-binding outer membrane protein SusC